MDDQSLPCGCTVINDKVVNWCELHRDTRGREMLLQQRDIIAGLEAKVAALESQPSAPPAVVERLFPIQSQSGAAPHPTRIPWRIADLAYSMRSGKYGRWQSLERLAERGGFCPNEMDEFVPGWREMCSPSPPALVEALVEALRELVSKADCAVSCAEHFDDDDSRVLVRRRFHADLDRAADKARAALAALEPRPTEEEG